MQKVVGSSPIIRFEAPGSTGVFRLGRGSGMADEETRAQLEIDPAVGTVEMKITARARDEDEVREALERADIEPEVREVYFFDTTDLTLFEARIVLRARLVHDGADDSTVKLRPIDPKTLSQPWKSDPKLELEVDAVGDEYVTSAKLGADQDRDRLRPLGPVQVHKWEVDHKELDNEVTVEEWVLPDRSDLVELSIKVDPNEAVEANERFVDYLRSRGFDTEGGQQTKTRAALEYFTGRSLG
jgi:hypothetical protein